MSDLGQEKNQAFSKNFSNIAKSLLFENSSDLIIIVKWNYPEKIQILKSNPFARKILKYSEHELEEISFKKLFQYPESLRNISQSLQSDRKTSFIPFNILTNGSILVPIEFCFELLSDISETEKFVIVIGRVTQNKGNEEKIHEVRVLLDSLTQPLILVNTSGIILECNSIAAKRIKNSEWQELIGKNLFNLLPSEISQSRCKKMQEVIDTKLPVDFIDERNSMTYNNHYYPIMNKLGDVDKIAILADDITLIDKLQKKLSLTQFSVDKSGIAIIWVNKDAHITYANEFASQLFGYSQKEFYDLYAWDIAPLHRQEIIYNIFNELKATDKYSNELIGKKSDGTEFPMFVNVDHLNSEGNSYYIVYLIDLSEKREYQWELNKLYYAVEQSPISISITDPDAIIEYVNPKYCKISGYSYEECIGKREGFLKSGDKSKIEYEEMWKTLKNRKIWHGVFHNKNKDGKSIWEKVTISSIIDHHGSIKNYLALKENITENKMLQEKLYQSQKMEALGRLAGGIAHDFNNLLTIILGYAQVLESEEDNPYIGEIKEIIKTTENAASLTAQLLAFSKRQILQPKLLDINRLIKQMYSMLRRTFPSFITLKFELTEHSLPVIIDKTQFEQVILNLTFNAKEAILPKGKGTIRISSKFVDLQNEFGKNQPYAQILIQDDGIGMDKTTQRSAFEPFFTTKLKGTGLGLSTVYGIVSQSNGLVEIESEIGIGTKFKAHFPIQFKKIEPSLLNNNELNSLSGEETILLIEDDRDVRKILSLLLKKSGYTVIEAQNGMEGLNLFQINQKSIDIVISDLVMPEMGGVEAVQRIRKIEPTVKSIFISGYTGEQQGILGNDEIIIAKPIDRLKLLETIRSVLCSVSNNSSFESNGINS